MTQDEIFEFAKQAGFEGCAELSWEDVICTDELVTFAKLVEKHEREACANLCEQHGYEHYCGNVTDKLAETIRARGQA